MYYVAYQKHLAAEHFNPTSFKTFVKNLRQFINFTANRYEQKSGQSKI